MKYTDQNPEAENQDGGQRGRGKKNRGGNQWETSTDTGTEPELQEEGLGGANADLEGGAGKRKKARKSRFDEQDFNQEGEQGGSFEGSGRPGRPIKVQEIAKKVMNFVEEHTADMDKDTLAKYAAVGVLLLAGMRKSGFLGGLAVSVAAGVITKLIVENASQMQEEWEVEGETEEEEVVA